MGRGKNLLIHGLVGNLIEQSRRGAPVLGRKGLIDLLLRLIPRVYLGAHLVDRVADARHGHIGNAEAHAFSSGLPRAMFLEIRPT